MIALRPKQYRSAETETRRFVALAGAVTEWWTAEEWVWYLDEARFWSMEMGTNPTEAAKLALVKRLLQYHDEGVVQGAFVKLYVYTEGDWVWVWKPERQFTIDDYRYVCEHYAAKPHGPERKKAEKWRARCWKRFRVIV